MPPVTSYTRQITDAQASALKSVLERRGTGSGRDRKDANDASGRDSRATRFKKRLREDHP